MVTQVLKRNGSIEDYSREKIAKAIYRAAVAVGGTDKETSDRLAREVEKVVFEKYNGRVPGVEDIQDVVEKVLIENRHAATAKAFILYREKRKSAREQNALIGATIDLFDRYLNDNDWMIKENSSQQKSVAGLNNFVRESFTKNYWLNEIYPTEVREAHQSGALHLHDLGFFGPYCVGWDLRQVLMLGFTGVRGKISSKPAKHLRSFLGQINNFTFTTSGETAGAQAWSSFDTYCAPFVRYDKLTYEQVKQCIQEFVFNLNVATRVGFQSPFSNLTFDIKVPKTLREEYVICGGEYTDDKYGDFQKEMDMINLAFCEVMMKGDGDGRVFTYPIPTINVTKDLDWNSPVVDAFMDITCKYGIPYFANYINSDLSPEDAVSMCCRLRLDLRELKKRGGGLFGSNPLTGSIGVVTLDMPRIGYLSKSKEEFLERVGKLCDIAKTSLEIKRKTIEAQTDKGLYPYCKFYLADVKRRTGSYWSNHFNTIGLVGMNEALLNFMGKTIGDPEGLKFAIEVMNYMRSKMISYQEETGHQYNLEATPAESTATRFAKNDRKRFKNIITAGTEEHPYYTNSTQLPVNFTDDIFECVKLQTPLQTLYTGGTVQHIYLGERIEDREVCKNLIKKIFSQSTMPYISITPSFSICKNHGYLAGEQPVCPECGERTEIWTRVTGFLRCVDNFNEGKYQEFLERKKYKINK